MICREIVPREPSGRPPVCNHCATQSCTVVDGTKWVKLRFVVARRQPHLLRLHAEWRPCPAGRQRATEATELTEPTDRRPVMKRLPRTTASRGTSPLPRVCGWGSRPSRDPRDRIDRTDDSPTICRFWQLRQAPANTSRDGTNLVWTTSTPAAGCLTCARTAPKRRLGYRAWARAEVRRLRWRVG